MKIHLTCKLTSYLLLMKLKRKCYKRDSEGNLVKEDAKTILLRDKENKIIYESVKGNF